MSAPTGGTVMALGMGGAILAFRIVAIVLERMRPGLVYVPKRNNKGWRYARLSIRSLSFWAFFWAGIEKKRSPATSLSSPPPQRGLSDKPRRELTRLGASMMTWPQLYVIVMMSSQHMAGSAVKTSLSALCGCVLWLWLWWLCVPSRVKSGAVAPPRQEICGRW